MRLLLLVVTLFVKTTAENLNPPEAGLYFSPANNSTSVLLTCPPGYFCLGGEKVACGDSDLEFCPEKSSRPRFVKPGNCVLYANETECRKNQNYSSSTSTTNFISNFSPRIRVGEKPCPAGYYCQEGRAFICEVGNICKNGRKLPLTEPGQIALNPGQTSFNLCPIGCACPDAKSIGNACANNSITTYDKLGVCRDCETGKFKYNNTHCADCPKKYNRAHSVIDCSNGYLKMTDENVFCPACYYYHGRRSSTSGGKNSKKKGNLLITPNTLPEIKLFNCLRPHLCKTKIIKETPRESVESENFVQEKTTTSCGELKPPTSIVHTMTTECATGYTGPLCASCDRGNENSENKFGKVGFQCEKCGKKGALFAIPAAVAAVFYITFVIRQSLSPDFEKATLSVLRIFSNYVQLTGILVMLQLDWGTVVRNLLNANSAVAGGAPPFVDCLVSFETATLGTLTSWAFLIPVMAGIAFWHPIKTYSCTRKCWSKKTVFKEKCIFLGVETTPARLFLTGLVALFYALWPVVLLSTLNIFRCEDVQIAAELPPMDSNLVSAEDNSTSTTFSNIVLKETRVLAINSEIECDTEKSRVYKNLYQTAYGVGFVFVFGFPALLAYSFYLARLQIKFQAYKARFMNRALFPAIKEVEAIIKPMKKKILQAKHTKFKKSGNHVVRDFTPSSDPTKIFFIKLREKYLAKLQYECPNAEFAEKMISRVLLLDASHEEHAGGYQEWQIYGKHADRKVLETIVEQTVENMKTKTVNSTTGLLSLLKRRNAKKNFYHTPYKHIRVKNPKAKAFTAMSRIFMFLYGGYYPDYFAWDFLVQLRKVALILAATRIQDSRTQLLAVFIINAIFCIYYLDSFFFIFWVILSIFKFFNKSFCRRSYPDYKKIVLILSISLVMHVNFTPYYNKTEQDLELYSLFAICFSIAVGAFRLPHSESEEGTTEDNNANNIFLTENEENKNNNYASSTSTENILDTVTQVAVTAVNFKLSGCLVRL